MEDLEVVWDEEEEMEVEEKEVHEKREIEVRKMKVVEKVVGEATNKMDVGVVLNGNKEIWRRST